MRFTLHLTPNTEPVPFNYLHRLTGVFHRWMGPNTLHDGTSLYGFGFLGGGRAVGRPRPTHLSFPGGATWSVGFHDAAAGRAFAGGVLADPKALFGMVAYEVREEAVPSFASPARFRVDGFVLVRDARPGAEGKEDHLLWTDPRADAALTRVLRWKLQTAGFDDAHVSSAHASFDRSYTRARHRVTEIRDIRYKGSECPVVIEGSPEVIRFAYLVGVGELTGSGLGHLALI